MANLKVNWLEVSNLSKRTLNNSEDFETARQKYQEIITSLSSCWKGTDADIFITNASHFLEYLKNDTNYLNRMGDFFDKGSKLYSGVVNEHEEKMIRFNQVLQEDQKLPEEDGRVA